MLGEDGGHEEGTTTSTERDRGPTTDDPVRRSMHGFDGGVSAVRKTPETTACKVDDVRRELAGSDLACWCPEGQPCHADVLLRRERTRPVAPPAVPGIDVDLARSLTPGCEH